MRLRTLLLLAALWRFAAAFTPRLNMDEGWAYYVVRGNSWMQVLEKILHDRHPPAPYLGLAGWSALTGANEWALRLPLYLTSVATVAVLYFLARKLEFDKRTALIACALYTGAFPAWEYDLWLRGQGVCNLLSLACLTTLVTRRWAVFTALAILWIYTHYLAIFFLGVMAGWHLLNAKERRPLLASTLIIVVAFSAWLPHLLEQFLLRRGDLAQGGAGWLAAWRAWLIPAQWFGLDLWPLPGLWGALCNAALAYSLLRMRARPLLVVLAMGLPYLLAALAGLQLAELLRPRYFALSVPYACLLVAPWLAGRTWLPALFCAGNLVLLGVYCTTGLYKESNWDKVAEFIRTRQRAGDALYFCEPDSLFAVCFYYAGDSLRYDVSDPRNNVVEMHSDALLYPHRIPNLAFLEATERANGRPRRVFLVSWPRNVTVLHPALQRDYRLKDGLVLPVNVRSEESAVYLYEREAP